MCSAQSGQKGGLALPVPQERFRLRIAAFCAAETRDLHLFWIPLVRLLRGVRVTGGVALGFHRGNVDVFGGREHHGVFGDLVVVERGLFTSSEPGVEDEHRERAMIAMVIDGPLREKNVRLFGIEHTTESLVVGVIDDGPRIVLPGESGARFQDSACFLGFSGANGGAAAEGGSAAESFTTIEVKQNNFVAELGIAGDRTRAAAFGIARMPACYNDFEPGCWFRFRLEWRS